MIDISKKPCREDIIITERLILHIFDDSVTVRSGVDACKLEPNDVVKLRDELNKWMRHKRYRDKRHASLQ